MASSGDIRAGRAAVELYVDQSELQKGLKQAETSIKNVDKNVGAMRMGMVANQFAVGLQDFAVVYEQSKDLGRALSAAANNAIQLMTLIHPMAGAITAAAIAAYQLYNAFSKTAQAAKDRAAAEKEAAEAAERTAAAHAREFTGTARGNIGVLSNLESKEDADKAIEQASKEQTAAEMLYEAEKKRRDSLERGTPAWSEASIATAEAKKEVEALRRRIELIKEARENLPDASDADAEAKAEAVWSEVKRGEDQWKIDTEARRQDDQKRESERWDEEKRSEADSVTKQFETKAERNARLSMQYDDMRWRGRAGLLGGITDDTYNRAMASLDQKSTSVVGTFSGAALGGLSASSPLVAIQRATERTAKATEDISKKKGGTFG